MRSLLLGILGAMLWQHVLAPLFLPPLIWLLRYDLFPTTDENVANTSPWQYGEVPRTGAQKDPQSEAYVPAIYTTSVLGIINGYLPKLGVRLTAFARFEGDDPSKPLHYNPPYLEVRPDWL